MDIKSVIRDYSLIEITLLMSNILKHANYLNAILKSLKTRGLTEVPGQNIAEVWCTPCKQLD